METLHLDNGYTLEMHFIPDSPYMFVSLRRTPVREMDGYEGGDNVPVRIPLPMVETDNTVNGWYRIRHSDIPYFFIRIKGFISRTPKQHYNALLGYGHANYLTDVGYQKIDLIKHMKGYTYSDFFGLANLKRVSEQVLKEWAE